MALKFVIILFADSSLKKIAVVCLCRIAKYLISRKAENIVSFQVRLLV